MAKEFENQYFLFGAAICEKFYCDSFEEALESAKEGEDFGLYEWNENSSPFDLLDEFQGYGDYAVLTKEQFEAFDAIKNE